MEEEVEKRELSDEELSAVVGGFHRGKQVDKYHIEAGKFYYIFSANDNKHVLALARTNNYESYYKELWWTNSFTVANILWVDGVNRGQTKKYEFINCGEEIYEAEPD